MQDISIFTMVTVIISTYSDKGSLNEFEFCLYQQACIYAEALLKEGSQFLEDNDEFGNNP